ncbi:MAG: GNAT family N-acetyltransferase [Clostridia bacterium]|nr:GNAT family N-acetyltransferase [Clostridia bacterium]
MIDTDRLHIRKLVPDDWREMQNIAMDFRRSEYAVYDMPLPVEEESIKALTAQLAASGLFFAVLREGVVIGYVCFHREGDSYDLGFCFHSNYHGKGYAFEACFTLMKYMAKTRPVAAFTAGTALENIPSCRLLRKLGFTLQKTERLSFHKDDRSNDITFEGGIFCYDRKDI